MATSKQHLSRASSRKITPAILCLRLATALAQRDGEAYHLTQHHKDTFRNQGLATLHNLLNDDELAQLEDVYSKFMNRTIHVPGRDFCDMSKTHATPYQNWSIVNCMLPTRYHPPLSNNIFERVAAGVAAQLFPDATMVKDYDQLLDKLPFKEDAVFAFHQDMAYWPPTTITKDTRTVTFSLAIDSTTEANGCIRYVPGSGVAKELRSHSPLGEDREDAHAVRMHLNADDELASAPCPRGSATIHDEYVVHGSHGNPTPGHRRTYVLAFRTAETVRIERQIGFTHSHNDAVNWDNWDEAAALLRSSSNASSLSDDCDEPRAKSWSWARLRRAAQQVRHSLFRLSPKRLRGR